MKYFKPKGSMVKSYESYAVIISFDDSNCLFEKF